MKFNEIRVLALALNRIMQTKGMIEGGLINIRNVIYTHVKFHYNHVIIQMCHL